ncbi:MAG: GTPase HflX [Pseudomonadota bacterium]
MVGVKLGAEEKRRADDSMAELAKLVQTAGGAVLESAEQELKHPNAVYLIGKGKVEEIKKLIIHRDADRGVFDAGLTPVQQKNLEEEFGVKVLDRTGLILDIFAQRARSKEGKLQVELAQLSYLLPRLVGQGRILSRLGGGIGTRGPGETKLEVDRRKVRDRIVKVKKGLEKVRKVRTSHRKRRGDISCSTLSIIGYTNAGKSTLMNCLSNAGVLVEDKLFSTLDPTIRKIKLPSTREILISDTVGFIDKLPHQLIAAFKATFEEVNEADILLHVMDITHPKVIDHISSVNSALTEIGVSQKPIVHILNKIDKLGDVHNIITYWERILDNCVAVSAVTGEGIGDLLHKVDQLIPYRLKKIRLRFPAGAGDLISKVHRGGRVTREEYVGREVIIEAEIDKRLAQSLKGFSF